MAIDALTKLALMTKAKLVFESEDTFLSFPALSPLTYQPEQLRFGAGGQTPADLAELSEFSRLVNRIPRSIIAPDEELEYVWDVYRDVLRFGQVATGDWTSDEKERYQAAIALLYATGGDGLRQDSESVRTYKQHRDAQFAALEDFKNRQMTAEASTDPAVLSQWTGTDEPALRAQLAALEQDWITNGHKAEVEAAQQTEQALAARSPALTWQAWQTSFMDDLDLESDAAMIAFAPTGFSPYDVFDADDWPRFTLSGAEMSGLAEQAPEELKGILASSEVGDIEEVSFEYRSVALTRPWFRPGVFRSRFWRLPLGSEGVSDGTDLADGRCPAYATAVVFARRIAVKLQPQATPSPPPDLHLLLALDPQLIEARRPDVMRLARPLRAAQNLVQPSVGVEAGTELVARAAPRAQEALVMEPRMVKLATRLSAVNFAARSQPARVALAGLVVPFLSATI